MRPNSRSRAACGKIALVTHADDYQRHLLTLDAVQDNDGLYVWVSASTPADWLGKTDREIQPSHLIQTIEDNRQTFLDQMDAGLVHELRMVREAERKYLVCRFHIDNGRIGIHAIDVTPVAVAHAKQAMADRLANISEISAGIAHEFNNPLTWIVGNLDYVNREMTRWRTPPTMEVLKDVQEAIQESVLGVTRLRTFIKELRTFSSITPMTGPVDLHRVVNAAIRMVGTEMH